jgi:hypothetical protein
MIPRRIWAWRPFSYLSGSRKDDDEPLVREQIETDNRQLIASRHMKRGMLPQQARQVVAAGASIWR